MTGTYNIFFSACHPQGAAEPSNKKVHLNFPWHEAREQNTLLYAPNARVESGFLYCGSRRKSGFKGGGV